MPSSSTLRTEIEQLLGQVYQGRLDGKWNRYDEIVPPATDAILSAFLARLPKEATAEHIANHSLDIEDWSCGVKGYAACLADVKKLLEIE